MKEVEILVEICEKKDSVIKKLSCFNFIGLKRTFDIYFYDPKRKDLKPDKSGSLKKCLRLRKKEGNCSLTYKIDRFDKKGIWLYSDEYEIAVSDFKETLKVLDSLGFKILLKIESNKRIYSYKKYEIVLEEVKNLGLFLEVENLLPSSSGINVIKKRKKEIFEFIKSTKIKIGGELNMGKPELMLKKNKKSESK